DIGVRIITQAPLQLCSHRLAQLEEIPIEVLAAAKLETPLMATLQQLTKAHRVRHRYQLDHTIQCALGFELGQALFQLPGGAHSRQFVSVQAGLDIGLALAAAEAKHRDMALAAQVAPRQWMI